MIKKIVKRFISDKQKLSLKSSYHDLRVHLINSFLSFDGEKLKTKLAQMGVKDTDTLLVHANFNPDSGFKGTPQDVVTSLMELVGEKGNLLMVSIPFRGSSYDYLMKYKPFNVKKTISMMGLVTEMFRRKKGVLRSLHPTHPVLAYGKDSAWIVEGHEKCLFPCGPGTPFDKFRQLDGKILFLDVDFGAITFFHYVEDLTKDSLPFGVYNEKPFAVKVFDEHMAEHTVHTYAFNPDIKRNAYKLETEMKARGLIHSAKVGNATLLLVTAKDVIACQTSMVESKKYPYDT